jgi:hypothetical protein
VLTILVVIVGVNVLVTSYFLYYLYLRVYKIECNLEFKGRWLQILDKELDGKVNRESPTVED